jgi:hypothetical protein
MTPDRLIEILADIVSNRLDDLLQFAGAIRRRLVK